MKSQYFVSIWIDPQHAQQAPPCMIVSVGEDEQWRIPIGQEAANRISEGIESPESYLPFGWKTADHTDWVYDLLTDVDNRLVWCGAVSPITP